MTYSGGVPLVEVVRSGFTEGLHRGSVVALDATGTPVAAAGDVTAPIFPRSSNKPMQAVGMLRAGLRLSDPGDLAMVAASHFGEPAQLTRVRALLDSGGFTEADLGCPPELPIGEDACAALLRAGGTASRLAMNCSGKHAGMLLTCQAAGWPVENYWAPAHPLQQRLRAAVEECAGEPAAAVGVDGCGAPVLAISLTALARAFLRLVEADLGTPERAVADAMRAHPELVGGTGGQDTRLMTAVPGLLAKVGAEGVFALAVPQVGAVALKIDDGAVRARPAVLVSALRRLGLDTPALAEFGRVPLYGRGEPVGALASLW